MTQYSGFAPVVGARVKTADGVLLGKVAEINGEFFKVDAPVMSDYWLSSRRISGTGDGDIHLDFAHHDLNTVMMHERPASGH